MTQAEDRLMDRYCHGDNAAFTELHALTRPHLYAMARGHAMSRDDADEIASEAMCRVVAKRHTFDPSQPFIPWVRRIASNLIVDWLRTRRQRPPVLSGPIGGREDEEDFATLFESREANPLDSAIANEEAGRAKAMLARLPVLQSEALWRFCCGEKIADISASTCCPLSTIKRRSNIARDRIRELMDVA